MDAYQALRLAEYLKFWEKASGSIYGKHICYRMITSCYSWELFLMPDKIKLVKQGPDSTCSTDIDYTDPVSDIVKQLNFLITQP
jgi:hypothetical protein